VPAAKLSGSFGFELVVPGGPLAFAHRGGGACWPENTLEAFRGALAAGCKYLETDLRTTRDGHIVLCHDEQLERTTDGQGKVHEHTLAELKRLDAGHRFSPDGRSFPARGQGVRIPTLEELVALSSEARFNVEIKQAEPPMIEALWSFIERRGLHERVLVAAEQDPLVQAFRRISHGRVATSAGRNECLKFWLASRLGAERWLSIDYQALQIPVSFSGLRVLTPRLLKAAHRRGVHVHVWTINDCDEMRALVAMGVDGIMSDYPARLVEAVSRPLVTDPNA
jgi:glycerophosphoryl diester phosphodiesterase